MFDLDSTLPFPCPALQYALETCAPQRKWPHDMEPRFRIIPAADYLAAFASDRSHMIHPPGSGSAGGGGVPPVAYTQPPPAWPAIQPPALVAAGSTMNLPQLWDMSPDAGSLPGWPHPHCLCDLRGLVVFLKTLPP